jgi:hypothetical protein
MADCEKDAEEERIHTWPRDKFSWREGAKLPKGMEES